MELDKTTIDGLRQVFTNLPTWRARLSSPTPEPSNRSSLASDDQATAPWQLSHAVVRALVGSVDNLDVLRSMVFTAREVYSNAPFTLIRGAIEGAATVAWLLAPKNRNERVLRQLRLQYSDYLDASKVLDSRKKNKDDDPYGMKDKMQRLQTLAKSRGFLQDEVSLVAARPVAYSSIVETAGGDTEVGSALALMSWRVCSGFAHNKLWSTLAVLDYDEVQSATEGVLDLHVRVSDSNLLMLSRVAVVMLADGWRLYDRQRSPAY